jgi:hypothetical protein
MRHIQQSNMLLEQRSTKTLITESQAQAMAQEAMKKAKSGDVDPGVKQGILDCIKNNKYTHLMVLTTGAGAYALGAIAALFVSGVGTPLALTIMAAGAAIMLIDGFLTSKEAGLGGGSVTQELNDLHACLKSSGKI